ncbi:ABC transporter ATP-binding protein [Salininema proteolyticum]|uniref:ABC transporter ATP-binding protein n=1 Tax=Salininema proteolyticum TaxID=1607685 RepID=A0ABV8U490_9ACTN
MPPVLTLTDITKSYPDGATERRVLSDLNVTVDQREVVGITGLSGSGKTTLLGIAGLLIAPDSGTVTIGDTEARHCGSQAAHLRHHDIGFVFQEFNLIDRYSVADNIRIAMTGPDSDARATDLINSLGLAAVARQPARFLSGGQKQRTALARALVNKPRLVLADEPVSGLDADNSRIVLDMLRQAAADGAAVLVASHDPTIDQITTRTVALDHGHVHDLERKPQR